jgi:phosphoserine phosphatase RsbU/P
MTSSRQRKTIAVLVDYVDHRTGSYESLLRAGFEAECRRLDLDLLIVAGRALDHPDPKSRVHARIYDLLHADCVDGIILVAGGLASHSGPEGVRRLCARYQGIPLASVGLAIAGVPSIVVDGRPGMHALVEHMVSDHKCRRIAFLGGPVNNPDARLRLEVYRGVLESHQIAFDEALVTTGEFNVESGQMAIDELFDRGARPEAIIAANDGLALGAIAMLRSHGLRVPHDILVTGFDDQGPARLARPPLTTVRQPLEAMASLAVRTIFEQIARRPTPDTVDLACELVRRESCGCGDLGINRSLPPASAMPETPTEFVSRVAPDLQKRLAYAVSIPDPTGTEWTARLVEALSAEVAGHRKAFLLALEGLLEQAATEDDLCEEMQAAVTTLRHDLAPIASPELEALWHDARRLIAVSNMRAQAGQRMDLEQAYLHLLQTGERFSTAVDPSALKRALTEELPRMNIRNAFVTRYPDPAGHELETFFCLRDGLPCQHPPVRFQARQLFPPGAEPSRERRTWFVVPLTFEVAQFGVAVFESGSGFAPYAMLRDQISVALKNLFLYAEIVQQTALHERSVQERVATAERMQSLSVLAGGVAHDLNNALGPLLALPDVILQELDDLHSGRTSDDTDMRSDLQTIKTASLRAAQTIKDLLTLGRQGQAAKEALDLNRAVAACLASDHFRFADPEHRGVTVALEMCPEPLFIDASEPHLARAVSNLVRNAVEAVGGTGRVVVRTSHVRLADSFYGYELVEPGDYAAVSVSDTGSGIRADQIRRVFEPFFSTKKLNNSSGSGLGLAIVHGVVKEHDGFLNVESVVGQGTTFTLYFRRSAESPKPNEEPLVSPRGSARILVVDDDPVQLRTAQRVLTRLGYQVATAESGVRAYETFVEARIKADPSMTRGHLPPSPFELVVIDMILGEPEDGLAVFGKIQQLFPGQVGLVVSGQAPTGRAQAAIDRGLHWLAKPYTGDALARAVMAALESNRS